MSSSMLVNGGDSGALAKPQNGIAGLRHAQYDFPAGMVVSLVSLPLSSGIAIASGVPPIYGLISAIIAGLVFPLIGGAYVTIAGPAAGLAPALMAIMVAMGGAGDADHLGAGYHHLLVIICIVGALQVLLSILKLARFAAIIPASVVEGMLAAIGVLIIVKQFPMFFGYMGKDHPHEFYEFVLDVPEFVHGLTPAPFGVAAATLVVLFVLDAFKNKVKMLSIIPPQLIAVVLGVIIGAVVGLQGQFLIKLPETAFNGFHVPDFAGLFARGDLWYAAIVAVATLTAIDGVESLATGLAVDRIDPFKRHCNPNRLLLAMGVCNMISSLVGGLTIIPGGVKSKVNIASGGRTLWANFTNALCLIVYLAFAYKLINMIPKGVLASVLIYTGWKMCEPAIWKHVLHIGKEQLWIYTFTVVATLATDLLWGIIAGVLVKFVYLAVIEAKNSKERVSYMKRFAGLFKNPGFFEARGGGEAHVNVRGSVTCFNAYRLHALITRIDPSEREVWVHVNGSIIDHNGAEMLLSLRDEFTQEGRVLHLDGLDRMRALSAHEHAMRVSALADAGATM